MTREHNYSVNVEWTGNQGTGTSDYRAYNRNHEIRAGAKAPIAASSDPAFRGDPARWNPEELLVSALSACHMLSFLHLAAVAKVVVVAYADDVTGTMVEGREVAGHFSEVTLHPRVTVKGAVDAAIMGQLHEQAHNACFIANSVNFPVRCEPVMFTEAL